MPPTSMRPRLFPALLALVVIAGCALYSDVIISPLIYVPANIERGGDVASMVRKYDYVNAVLQAPAVDQRSRPNAAELAALGSAEYASGRFDAARRHLRAARNSRTHVRTIDHHGGRWRNGRRTESHGRGTFRSARHCSHFRW